jgi:hypothetical protein
MRRAICLTVAIASIGGALAASAYAFDCIRVSSSLNGLQHSTKSGNWLLFDISSASGVQNTIAQFGGSVSASDAACVASEYAKSGQPRYFALGIGVAGGQHGGPGVLAHNNPNGSVLANGRGIDHLEDTGINAALEAAAATCGVVLPD